MLTEHYSLFITEPHHFPYINSNGLSHNALSKHLITSDKDVTVKKLQSE